MKTRIELKLDRDKFTVTKVTNRTDVLPGDRLTKEEVDELIHLSRASTQNDLTLTIAKK
jgi:hypothetical protein